MTRPITLVEQAMPIDQFAAELEGIRARYHPNDSRFVQAISNGTASKEAIKNFAKDFYHYVKFAHPQIAALASLAPDVDSFWAIGSNLAGELGAESENHYKLFCDFCEGVGAPLEECEAAQPLAETIGAMYTLAYFCRRNFEEGVVAFSNAIEGSAEKWNVTIYEGLSKHYDYDQKTLRFWSLHVKEETGHAETGRKLLEKFARSADQQRRVKLAFLHASITMRAMFDAWERFLHL